MTYVKESGKIDYSWCFQIWLGNFRLIFTTFTKDPVQIVVILQALIRNNWRRTIRETLISLERMPIERRKAFYLQKLENFFVYNIIREEKFFTAVVEHQIGKSLSTGQSHV